MKSGTNTNVFSLFLPQKGRKTAICLAECKKLCNFEPIKTVDN